MTAPTKRVLFISHEAVEVDHIATLRDSPHATAQDLWRFERLRVASHEELEQRGTVCLDSPGLALASEALEALASFWDPSDRDFTLSQAVAAGINAKDVNIVYFFGTGELAAVEK